MNGEPARVSSPKEAGDRHSGERLNGARPHPRRTLQAGRVGSPGEGRRVGSCRSRPCIQAADWPIYLTAATAMAGGLNLALVDGRRSPMFPGPALLFRDRRHSMMPPPTPVPGTSFGPADGPTTPPAAMPQAWPPRRGSRFVCGRRRTRTMVIARGSSSRRLIGRAIARQQWAWVEHLGLRRRIHLRPPVLGRLPRRPMARRLRGSRHEAAGVTERIRLGHARLLPTSAIRWPWPARP